MKLKIHFKNILIFFSFLLVLIFIEKFFFKNKLNIYKEGYYNTSKIVAQMYNSDCSSSMDETIEAKCKDSFPKGVFQKLSKYKY